MKPMKPLKKDQMTNVTYFPMGGAKPCSHSAYIDWADPDEEAKNQRAWNAARAMDWYVLKGNDDTGIDHEDAAVVDAWRQMNDPA